MQAILEGFTIANLKKVHQIQEEKPLKRWIFLSEKQL